MFIRVGILYEGENDSDPLKIIISKIIKSDLANIDIIYTEQRAGGSITTKIKPALINFFNLDNPCKIGIFIADADGDSKKAFKLKKIVTKQKADLQISESCIVVCPNPTLEQWLVVEQDSAKKIFGLDSAKKIKYQDLHPKEALSRLFLEIIKDQSLTLSDIYSEIAKGLNLDTLKQNDKDFKKFATTVSSEIKRLKLRHNE